MLISTSVRLSDVIKGALKKNSSEEKCGQLSRAFCLEQIFMGFSIEGEAEN